MQAGSITVISSHAGTISKLRVFGMEESPLRAAASGPYARLAGEEKTL